MLVPVRNGNLPDGFSVTTKADYKRVVRNINVAGSRVQNEDPVKIVLKSLENTF